MRFSAKSHRTRSVSIFSSVAGSRIRIPIKQSQIPMTTESLFHLYCSFTPFYGNLECETVKSSSGLRLLVWTLLIVCYLVDAYQPLLSLARAVKRTSSHIFKPLQQPHQRCGSRNSNKVRQRSFTQTDPITGADTGKVNYNVLEFVDRPVKDDEENSHQRY